MSASAARGEIEAGLRRAGLRADEAQVEALLRTQPMRAADREAMRRWLMADDDPAGPIEVLGAFADPDHEDRR